MEAEERTGVVAEAATHFRLIDQIAVDPKARVAVEVEVEGKAGVVAEVATEVEVEETR